MAIPIRKLLLQNVETQESERDTAHRTAEMIGAGIVERVACAPDHPGVQAGDSRLSFLSGPVLGETFLG